MTPPISRPAIQLEQFDGPLDLLLEEVRRQNVPLEKIALAPIVACFLDYVRTAAGRNLNLDIEWLHMAATLIQWKSRSLLPATTTEGAAAADPIRDSLVQQLAEHRKQAAGDLARRQSLEGTRFGRAADAEFRDEAGQGEIEPVVSVWDMMQQARELAQWAEQQQEHRRYWLETLVFEDDDVSVAAMMDYLQGCLSAGGGTVSGSDLLHNQPTASHRSSLFLGMLELVRDEQLKIKQDGIFESILLLSTNKSIPGPELSNARE